MYKNPDVKGIRLDSIVSDYRYLNSIAGDNGYTRFLDAVFEYPEDGGAPTVKGRIMCDGYIMTGCDTTVFGVKLNKNSCPKPFKLDDPDCKFNDKLDPILNIHREYDSDHNLKSMSKDTTIYDGGYSIKINYKYDIANKVFVATKKTKTKSNKYGWIVEQYVYDADSNGNFGDYSYSIVRNMDGANFGDAISEGKATGTVTSVENGVRTTRNIVTFYFTKENRYAFHRQRNDSVCWKERNTCCYSATYYESDLDVNDGEKHLPFLMERKILTFMHNNDRKYTVVNVIGDGIKNVPCNIFDSYGYLIQEYNSFFWAYKDVEKCLSDYQNKNKDNVYYEGDWYEYAYLNGVNVGCTYRHVLDSEISSDYELCIEVARDLNYTNVIGSDAICPIIYTMFDEYSHMIWEGHSAYSVYYYSSENGTLEPKNSTAITDVTENQKQNIIRIYDVNGTLVRTCTDGKITLPETHGIYIINNGGKVTKAVF